MVTSEEGLSPSASPSSALFLVDHAWTYRIDQHGSPRSQLHQIPGLLERMASLMDIAVPSALDATSRGALVSEVLTEAWRFNHTYHIGNDEASVEASLPIWYLMDEVGTRIQHSDTPTARVAPFFSAASGYALSVVWLLCDLDHMDEVTRDFAMGVADPERRRLLLLPWAPLDVTTISPQPKQVSENFFRAARKNETLPKAALVPPRLPGGRKIRVYAEYEFVESFLTHPRFEIVTSAAAADILWLRSHVKDYESLSDKSPDRFVNQFPYEHVLTVKDLLAVVCRRGSRHGVVLDEKTMSSSPPWIPLTYNLESELESFLSCFQRRENLHLDNHWILKPWNLARGLDIYITSSLDQVLKLSQTGPKIIQKYIHYPVLFHRPDVGAVKFDVRYVVMLSCVKPLKLFAFKVFWLRFANRPFSLDHYDDYQKHFTVMNYASPEKLLQMHYDEFIPAFEEQHSGFIWNELEKDIFEMIKEVFKCAVAKEPPEGLGHSPQSRALYAIDLMLSWSGEGENRKMQPQICEINFMPDCERACKYHPFFFNEVFSVLFLDEYEGLHVERLL
jgi:tubulin--tyrosine ligase-like protein 12